MKRILATVILCLLAINVILSQTFTVDNIRYQVTSSVEPLSVEVTSKTPQYEGDIVIPSTVEFNENSYVVNSIGEGAFNGCTGLTSVEIPISVIILGEIAFRGCSGLTSISIPHSVTSIGYEAFSFCTGLTSVIISNSVTSIGGRAFHKCTGLTSIDIPNSVTSIGDYAFSLCAGLTSIDVATDNNFYASLDGVLFNKDITTLISCPAGKTSASIPNSVTSIGGGAFSHCKGLTSIIIPNSVEIIGMAAFFYCTGLTEVNIPNSVTSVGENAFDGCSGLTSVNIPNSVTSIRNWTFADCISLASLEIPNSVTSIGDMAFYNCIGLTSITIPNSVTSIGMYAFINCRGLTSINIPNSVASMGMYAFSYCTGLTYIVCHAISPPSLLGSSVFLDVPKTIPLYVPNESINDYQAATQWNDFLDIRPLTINLSQTFLVGNIQYQIISNVEPYSVEVTSKSPLYESDIVIPSTVEFIGYNFSVTSIREWAFYGCTGLTSIEIPGSVTSIGEGAFYGCTGLTSIEISSDNYNYASIDGVLYNKDVTTLIICPVGKTSVLIPSSITSIGNAAFHDCTGLTSIEIPNSVTSIGGAAFNGCTGLTSIEIPSSVTSIGNGTFAYCTGLTSITIPNSVTSIGEGAFSNCTGLTSITIPNSVTSIEEGTFAYCSGLTSITIPNSVIRIRKEAFYSCTGLTSLVIGNSVTSIGEAAFVECTGLTSLEIPNSVTFIGCCSFAGCKGLTSLVIGNSVTYIGYRAFADCKRLTIIECHAISPPSLGTDVFLNVHKTIPLYVPDVSISAYQAADGWDDFLYILPLTTLNTEFINTLELVVYPNPVMDMLSIKGVEENTMVKIYDIKGQHVFSTGNIHENQSIDIGHLPSGIYVVKVVQKGKSKMVRVIKQ